MDTDFSYPRPATHDIRESSLMMHIQSALAQVKIRIADAESRFGRPPGSVQLLAVSKTKTAQAVRAAYQAGQHLFGENQVQEAVSKIAELSDLEAQWHFIGPVQSNKTRAIATHFAWVHSIDRLKIAQRLSDQRDTQVPLNICIQVNVSGEQSKSGVTLAELPALAMQLATLPRIKLRGLMAIPKPVADFDAQRSQFRLLRDSQEVLNAEGLELDTLSMGMTDDMEAAIAEGATMVRIGTAIFGTRSH